MIFSELKRLLIKEFKDSTIDDEDSSLTIDCGLFFIRVSDWGDCYELEIETLSSDFGIQYFKILPRNINRAFAIIKSRTEFIKRFLLMESI